MKTLKLVLSLGILVAGVYVAYTLLPVYLSNYRFRDAVDEEVKYSTYSTKSESDIRESVVRKARDLEIPIKPEQIQIFRGDRTLTIRMQYTVHVDLPLYPLDLNFKVDSTNKAI